MSVLKLRTTPRRFEATNHGLGVVKNMFRIDAPYVQQLCDQLGVVNPISGNRLDAGETMFLVQQLEHMVTTVYETRYPELRARTFLPVDTSIPAGAESYAYEQWDMFGMAKIIHDYADDLPMVGQFSQKVTGQIRTIGNAFGYSIQDLQAATFAGRPLSTDLAKVARRAYEQLFDDVAATGDSIFGLVGFLNHPNVTLFTLPTGGWGSATPSNILKDLIYMANAMATASKQLFTPDTLLVDQVSWGYLQTPFGTDNPKSILSTFLEQSVHIKNVDVWYKLDTADAAGTGPRIVMYKRSPEVVRVIEPQPFTMLPPQWQNLKAVVPCHGRHGGVQMIYPLGVGYADNAN